MSLASRAVTQLERESPVLFRVFLAWMAGTFTFAVLMLAALVLRLALLDSPPPAP